MTLSNESHEDPQRLDWQILRSGGVALYWRREYLADDVQWLAAHNYEIYQFDCERWVSEEEMYADIGRVLRFTEWWGPEWGHNINALDDCLTDLPIREDGGAALVLRKFNIYAASSGSALMHSGRTEAEALLDVIVRTCRFFLLNRRRLVTLVQTDDPEIRLGPLGAVSVKWNPREWLNAKRRPESP